MRMLRFVVVALVSVVVLSSCAFLPFGVGGVENQRGDARMKQIANAVNSHDAAALKALFSVRAREQAVDLDKRLDYFLSFFPNGGLTWERDSVGSSGDYDGRGNDTELLDARYKVSAGGNDYWFVFKDFPVNAIDPENVGLYGLGVAPWSDNPLTGPERPLFVWAGSIQLDGPGKNGYPGIFVPK